MKHDSKAEQALMTEIWDPAIADDPYRFVMFAYPWGKAGTPLEHYKGPRTWQREDLEEIGEHIKQQRARGALEIDPTIFRKATASGRGIGKSSLVSWLAHWQMSCQIGSTCIVTANNESQLKSKTFAEIGKWLTMAINGHWFDRNVLSVFPSKWFKEALERQMKIDTQYYYTQGQLWTEENPDAFAGAHNPLGMMVLMDEASGIPDTIFSVTKGFFTEKSIHRYWMCYSNPRRNSGAFFNCFHHPETSKLWRKRQLDSRTVEDTDTQLFNDIIKEDGADSYAARVEVLGQFPVVGDKQFISNEIVLAAQEREIIRDPGAPLMMGVDVARFGDDWNVVRFRQGLDARGIPPARWQGTDTTVTADRVAALIDKFQPDAVCIDQGQGTGVIDILRRLKYRIHEIPFGSSAAEHQWANKATEMYASARTWLKAGCLDAHSRLFTDLTAREYGFHGQAKDKIILEQKELFKARVGHSPDDGDAFVLTFAVKAARRDMAAGRRPTRVARDVDYSLFG